MWKVHFALLVAHCGFSSSYIINKVALSTGVNLVVLAVYRDIVACVVLIPSAYFAERIFCSQLVMLIGLSLTTATSSSAIAITVPVLVFIIATIFGLEQIRWKHLDGQAKVGGFISAVCGAVLLPLYKGPVIIGLDSQALQSVPLSETQLSGFLVSTLVYLKIDAWQLGQICFFLTGLCYAIQVTLQVPILKRYPAPISVSAFGYFVGAVELAMTGILTIQDPSQWRMHEGSVAFAFLYSGVVPSATSFTLQTWVVKNYGPALAAAYHPLQTVLTVSMAFLFLGESIRLGSILGSLLIINGLFLITWGQYENRRATAQSVKPLPTPYGQPTIKSTSDLEEHLLGEPHSKKPSR